jgi:hypothetical protein
MLYGFALAQILRTDADTRTIQLPKLIAAIRTFYVGETVEAKATQLCPRCGQTIGS